MAKSIQSLVLLMLIGFGLALYGLYQIFKGDTADHVFLGLAYLAAGAVGIGALFSLARKPGRTDDPV